MSIDQENCLLNPLKKREYNVVIESIALDIRHPVFQSVVTTTTNKLLSEVKIISLLPKVMVKKNMIDKILNA